MELENSEINKLAGLCATTANAYRSQIKFHGNDPREQKRMEDREEWWRALNYKLLSGLAVQAD